MIELEPALKALSENKVDFVIVGEIVTLLSGWKTVTMKLEIAYSRKTENLKKIISALSQFNPHPRGFPENLPYIFDEKTLQNATNFTFNTDLGDIDLLGEVAGVGNYQDVFESSEKKILFDIEVNVLTIEGLIKAKRAAGRTKDLLVLPELEALREVLSDEE